MLSSCCSDALLLYCFKNRSNNLTENLSDISKTVFPKDASYLEKIEYKNTIKFIPPVMFGKVVKVYDGDTITIASKLSIPDSPVYRFSVRLAGIDSAEIKGETNAEKTIAIQSRDALHKLIFGKIVTLKDVSIEKYGRILATVYYNDINVCKWMLDNNYAIPYDGGTKQRPPEWDEQQIPK